MLILLLFHSRFFLLRFKVTEPLVLFQASSFCPLHPSSLMRIGEHVLLLNGANVFERLYFCPEFLLITVFMGWWRCSEWQKASNNIMYEQREVYFSYFSFCNFCHVGFT